MSVGSQELMIPMLPCVSLDDTLDFYQALGFDITYRQTRPYLYGAVRRGGCNLHFVAPPKGLDPYAAPGSCQVKVVDVEPYHRAFTDALRLKYGKVPATGRPRITRFRPGQSRFTVIDPSGNSVIWIRLDESEDLDYGGSKELTGLAKAIDNARILRDFKNDDTLAARVLDVAISRYGKDAASIDRVRALAARTELAMALGDAERARALRTELQSIHLTEEERACASPELRAAEDVQRWLAQEADRSTGA